MGFLDNLLKRGVSREAQSERLVAKISCLPDDCSIVILGCSQLSVLLNKGKTKLTPLDYDLALEFSTPAKASAHIKEYSVPGKFKLSDTSILIGHVPHQQLENQQCLDGIYEALKKRHIIISRSGIHEAMNNDFAEYLHGKNSPGPAGNAR